MFRYQRRRTRLALTGGLGALALLASASEALAGDCSQAGPHLVYTAGGTSQVTLMGAIATAYANLSSPITILYNSETACTAYGDLINQTAETTFLYWTAAGVQQSCTDIGTAPVLAVMGNSQNLCTGAGFSADGGLASGYGVFLGPVQPIDFIVPFSSNAQSISTEAAFFVYGYDAASASETVQPWSTPANIFTRSSTSFATLFLGLETGIPASVLQGTGARKEASGTALVSAVGAFNGNAGPDQTVIGIASGEGPDQNRSAPGGATIKELAYQHTGQTCGYWPDSNFNTFDKVNVRDGQYWLWSPVHFYAAVGANNAITNADAASLINAWSEAAAPLAGLDVFATDVTSFAVPKCAMQVWRDGDLAEPYSFEPAAPCSCKFDFAESNANKPSTCKTCTQDSDCTTNHCRNIGPPLNADAGANVGYCEVN